MTGHSTITAIQKIGKNELLALFEKMSARIEYLPDEDMAFVMLFLNSQKYRTIAKATGLSDSTISRKLRRLAVRISSDNFLTAFAKNNNVLREKFISGKTVTQIKRETGLSGYMIRKIIRTISEEPAL